MNRRDKQAGLRLEKISEASSPSPKREQNLDSLKNSRLIPFASVTLPSPKKPPQGNEDKANQLNLIREAIMDRKQRLTLWE
jgi:hypothetical protein